MKTLFFSLLFSFSAFAKTQIYKVENGHLLPTDYQYKKIETKNTVEVLPVRVRIKKFTVIKEPSGVSVSFQPLCEFSTQVEVSDLTSGGLISEVVYGSCPAQKDGKNVTVVASGMVYDAIGATFSDEQDHIRRNFFNHLYLTSSEVIFGLGDFNLGTTKSFPFKHWMSELSTDSPGGRGQREGFISAVRYGN